MSDTTSNTTAKTADRAGSGAADPRAIVLGLVFLAVCIAAMFGVAGRWDWWAAWGYLGLAIVVRIVVGVYLKRKNPELLRVRMRIGEGTEPWDRFWLAGMRLLLLAMLVTAALDAVRFGWSSMGIWHWLFGAVLFIAGTAVSVRAMAENTFFEGTVRIQDDRDHRVIDTGPYAVVRHPGYAGFLLALIPTPLLLGSWWAFLPTALFAAWLILRIVLEERTLRDGLEGYGEYTGRVRYRLIPGIW
jgi:protein-S-isoprenylcysteine O-methyltransferase Ste14